jgi:Zn-dependent protease
LISDFILNALLAIVPVILAITLHETAHGYAALALGDTTARDQGRLTLNPLKHIDKMGTIILPGILLIGQLLTIHRVAFMFGWAKPVPVSAWKFTNPRQGMAIVAIAGPAMNFFLAWLTAVAGHAVPGFAEAASYLEGLSNVNAISPVIIVLLSFMITNLVLGLFNLLPILPLDGGRVVAGILPERLARFWAGLERYGILIVLVVILVLPNIFNINPIGDALDAVLPRTFRVIFWLAGYP